jgi:hypothetical protein
MITMRMKITKMTDPMNDHIEGEVGEEVHGEVLHEDVAHDHPDHPAQIQTTAKITEIIPIIKTTETVKIDMQMIFIMQMVVGQTLTIGI